MTLFFTMHRNINSSASLRRNYYKEGFDRACSMGNLPEPPKDKKGAAEYMAGFNDRRALG